MTGSVPTILFTWQLGDALGHIARLRPLALELKRRGFRVVLAASNLRKIAAWPGSMAVIPAPAMEPGPVTDRIREPATFADVLFNQGVTHADSLAGAVRAWRGIFDLLRPAVVVQDYSPTALLALQGHDARSLLLGTGFACPPNVHPLPDIRAWQNHYPERLQMTERNVLEALNRQLAVQHQPRLGGIGELYTRVDANCLATFPELDHYPQRLAAQQDPPEYVGVWSDLGGGAPPWPRGDGPRIFAYLKPFRALPRLLDHLAESSHSCLVYLGGEMDVARWQADNLRIVGQPLDMAQVARDCDMAILHAGHGSTAQMLLAGKPVLQLPFNVEQYHTARNTERLGAGAMVLLDDTEAIIQGVDRILADAPMREAAARFARRHRGFDQGDALKRVADRVEALAQS